MEQIAVTTECDSDRESAAAAVVVTATECGESEERVLWEMRV